MQSLGRITLFGVAWQQKPDNTFSHSSGVPFAANTKVRIESQSHVFATLEVDWNVPGYRTFVELNGPVVRDPLTGVYTFSTATIPIMSVVVGKPLVGQSDDPFRVGLGPIQISIESPIGVKDGDDIKIQFGDFAVNQQFLIKPDPKGAHPLNLRYKTANAPVGFLRLDLPNARAVFEAGTFLGEVTTRYEAAGPPAGPAVLHELQLASRDLALPLDRKVTEATVAMGPRDGAPPDSRRLFLNLELGSRTTKVGEPIQGTTVNTLLPAAEVRDFDLAFTFGMSADPLTPRLKGLAAVPEEGGSALSVACYAAADQYADSLVVDIADPPGTPLPRLDLLVRLGSPLLSDNTNVPGLVVGAAAVAVHGRATEIHGAVAGMWGPLAGGTGLALKGRHVSDKAKVASSLGRPPGTLPTNGQIDAALLCYESLPVLARTAAAATAVQGYLSIPLTELTPPPAGGKAPAAVEPLAFKGKVFEWPVLDVDRLRVGNWSLSLAPLAANPLQHAVTEMNALHAAGSSAVAPAQLHSSGIAVDADTTLAKPRGIQALVPIKSPEKIDEKNLRPALKDHTTHLDFNSIVVKFKETASAPADNPAPKPGDVTGKGTLDFIPADRDWFDVTIKDNLGKAPVLLKLEMNKGLDKVVRELPDSQADIRRVLTQFLERMHPQDEGVDILDPHVLEPKWTGAIFVAIDGAGPTLSTTDKAPNLKSLVDNAFTKPVRYLAVSAKPPGGAGDGRYAGVYGTYRYVDTTPLPPDPQNHEVSWKLTKVDLRFQDGHIVRFDLAGVLTIKRFWTDDKTKPPVEFDVFGKYQAATDENNPTGKPRIVFEAKARKSLELRVEQAFVDKIVFRSLAVYLQGSDAGHTRFELDGEIRLREDPQGGPFKSFIKPDVKRPVLFSRLGIPKFEGIPHLSWDLPSMEFPLVQQKPISLGPLSFRFTGLGLGLGADLKNSLIPIGGDLLTHLRSYWMTFDVDLFKYASLGPKAGKSFGLKLVAATDGTNRFLGLRGLDFEKLDVDLLGFLRITADKITAESQGGVVDASVALSIDNVKLQILGRTLLSDLYILIIQKNGRVGFAAFFDKTDKEVTLIPGVLKLTWVLLAHNIALTNAASSIITVSPPKPEDVRKKILDDCKKADVGGAHLPGRWGFGIGFDVLEGTVRAKMLFVEGGPVGLFVESSLLKSLFGLEALAIAYIRGGVPDLDRFSTEFRIPNVNLGPFKLTGGAMGVDVYLNGGIQLDVGFPWLDNGRRRWDRAFGLQLGDFVGHAGTYIRYTRRQLQTGTSGPLTEVTIGAGFALAVGKGVDFDFGILHVSVSIEIYAVLEGSVSLVKTSLTGYTLSGAIGIIVQGTGELNVWVLSARIHVYALAEAGAALTWHEPAEHALLHYHFLIAAGFEASCEVGVGFFSFTFSVSVHVTLQFSGQFEL